MYGKDEAPTFQGNESQQQQLLSFQAKWSILHGYCEPRMSNYH